LERFDSLFAFCYNVFKRQIRARVTWQGGEAWLSGMCGYANGSFLVGALCQRKKLLVTGMCWQRAAGSPELLVVTGGHGFVGREA